MDTHIAILVSVVGLIFVRMYHDVAMRVVYVNTVHGRLDSQYFRVKLDRVPTKRQDQTPLSIDDIELEIGSTFPKFLSLTRPLPARWLAAPDKFAEQRAASMVFAFTSEADARCFYEESTIFVCAMPCKTARFEERSRKSTQPTHDVQVVEEPRRAQHPTSPHDLNDQVMSPPTVMPPDVLAEERRICTENERKPKLSGISNKGPETTRLRSAPNGPTQHAIGPAMRMTMKKVHWLRWPEGTDLL